MNYDITDEGQHTKLVISADNLIDAPVIVGAKKGVAPLLYQGTGILADSENPLVLPLLTADSTAYSYLPDQPIKEVLCHLKLFRYFRMLFFSTLMLLVETLSLLLDFKLEIMLEWCSVVLSHSSLMSTLLLLWKKLRYFRFTFKLIGY